MLWLAYLCFPVVVLLRTPRPPELYVAFAVGIGVFLWLYLRAFSLRRLRPDDPVPWSLLGWAWSLVMYALTAFTLGSVSGTFLIYGASFVGFQARTSHAIWGSAANTAVLLLPVALGQHRPEDQFWLVPNALIMLSAAYGNHASYRRILADRRLTQLQLEKESLAQVAERERIARDLHDLLGHTLSVIVLKSELASKLTGRDPARAAQEIREVERISRDALREVRAAVRGYRGSGLNVELGRSKIALDAAGVTLAQQGELPNLPAAVEATLEMSLREAITNVVRHAQARQVHVTLARVDGHAVLDVHDDGQGGDAPEGNGLTGMRERVRALGGQVTRDTRVGTRLVVRIPTPDAPPAGGATAPARHAGREVTG